MDGDGATLAVGFEIDFGDAFGGLKTLDDLIGKAAADGVRAFQQLERSIAGGLGLGDAAAQYKTFGAAATRELQNTQKEMSRAEAAADRLTARLADQATTFGMTRAGAAAYRAEQAGATAAATDLTEAEARLNALRRANAAQLTAGAGGLATYATGMAGVGRSAQGAQIEMLEMTHIARSLTEQMAAGVSPFRALTLESGRLMTAIQYGGAGVGGFVKQFASMLGIIRTVQDAELAEAAASAGAQAASIAAVAARARGNIAAADTEVQLALASQRVAITDAEATVAAARLTAGYEAQEVAAAQLKIAEDALSVAQGRAAEAAEASAAATSTGLGATSAVLIPFAAVATTAFAAFKQFQGQVKDSGDLTRYRDNLGLTHQQMLQLSDGVDKAGGKVKELTDVTVTAGDVMAGLWKTIRDDANTGGAWDKLKGEAATAFGYVLEAWGIASAGITAGIYGTFNAVEVVWKEFPAVFGDLFVQGVNAAITALNGLVKMGVDALNDVIAAADKIPGVKVGQITAPQIAPMDNANAGAAAKAEKAIRDGYVNAYADARKADAAFWSQVDSNSKQHLKDRMSAEADALKANERQRKPNDHGLGNALADLDAQIRGQQALAKAYQVNDAEALKAEALQRAEEQAIRHKGDTGVFYEKELALAVAKAGAEGGKRIADLVAQASAQKQVNDAVAAGVIPASQMGQALQATTEKRQLIAALAVAEEQSAITGSKKWADQVVALKDELANLAKTQAEANAQANRAQVLSSTATGNEQLARLRLEATLIGATNEARAVAIAQLEAEHFLAAHPGATTAEAQAYVDTQKQLAKLTAGNEAASAQFNEQLRLTATLADSAADSMAKSFGKVGGALGDVIKILGEYGAKQADIQEQIKKGNLSASAGAKLTGDLQMSSLIGITDAAKNLFSEHSKGYKAMEAAEKALALIQLARTAVSVAAGAGQMFAELGPFAFPAVAAMLAVMASLGFKSGGKVSAADYSKGNTGTGTVLGDPDAQSASIKASIDLLKGVDDKTLSVSRDMLAQLRSIDNNIGNLAVFLVRTGNLNASVGVNGGFKSDIPDGAFTAYRAAVGFALGGPIGAAIGAIANKIPVIGDIFNGIAGVIQKLFGTKTKVIGSGVSAGPQTVGDILSSGLDAQAYEDLQKKHKFFGITTSTKFKTDYGALDPSVATQFDLILKGFDQTILAAAGPLGLATDSVTDKLNSFVVDIGKIDLKGLSADDIQKKLEAVFGAAGDNMAEAAIPGFEKFQKAGEGYLQTLVRVSSTVEQVDATMQRFGRTTTTLGVDIDMAIADLFDSADDYTSAANTYFQDFYSKQEQATAETAQFTKALASLGLQMPGTLDDYRQLVDAQDLTTDAGQKAYATLLQLAPAFYDLKTSLEGAKSAADVLSEQQQLQSQLWELTGDTASIRAAQLATLDPSNRALQQQIYAIQDAQDAAKAASDLADAWKSVGDSILDEINRIRGLTDPTGSASFATLMGQFNAATSAARLGDQDAAKTLPDLSKALLDAAADAATSRQELDRVQAQTAASLEATYAAISGLTGTTSTTSTSDVLAGLAATNQASTPAAANDDLASEIAALRAEVAQLRADNNAGHAATAGNTGAMKKTLDSVTQASGGDAISTVAAAA